MVAITPLTGPPPVLDDELELEEELELDEDEDEDDELEEELEDELEEELEDELGLEDDELELEDELELDGALDDDTLLLEDEVPSPAVDGEPAPVGDAPGDRLETFTPRGSGVVPPVQAVTEERPANAAPPLSNFKSLRRSSNRSLSAFAMLSLPGSGAVVVASAEHRHHARP